MPWPQYLFTLAEPITSTKENSQNAILQNAGFFGFGLGELMPYQFRDADRAVKIQALGGETGRAKAD